MIRKSLIGSLEQLYYANDNHFEMNDVLLLRNLFFKSPAQM